MISLLSAATSYNGNRAKLCEGTSATDLGLYKRSAPLCSGPSLQKKYPRSILVDSWPKQGALLDFDFANDQYYSRGFGNSNFFNTFSFTRNTNGNCIQADGNYLKFERLTSNLLKSAENPRDTSGWSSGSAVVYDVLDHLGKYNAVYYQQTSGGGGFRSLNIGANSESVTVGEQVVFSVYVKKHSTNRIGISTTNKVYWSLYDFDSKSVLLTSSSCTAGVENVNNEWMRIWFNCATTVTGSQTFCVILLPNDHSTNPTTDLGGSLYNGFSAGYPQLELGTTLTSFNSTYSNSGLPRFCYGYDVSIKGPNKAVYSEDLNKWYMNGITVSIMTDIPLPSSCVKVWRIQQDTSTTRHALVNNNFSFGDYYTIESIYVKSDGTSDYCTFGHLNSGVDTFYTFYGIVFNFSTKTITKTPSFNTSNSRGYISSTVTELNDGWFKLSFISYCNNTVNWVFRNASIIPHDITLATTNNVPLYTSTIGNTFSGDGVTGIYATGYYVEVGQTLGEYYSNGFAHSISTSTIVSPKPIGILIEASATNRLLWCRDATNSAWVKTNISCTRTGVGIDGTENSASCLTATSSLGTCIQTVTLSSSSRSCSVFMKRVSGTGRVWFMADGITWSNTFINENWNRISLSGTLTLSTIGIMLENIGDAVLIDYAQIEDSTQMTSPILTTSAQASRSLDTPVYRGSPLQNLNTVRSCRTATVNMYLIGGGQDAGRVFGLDYLAGDSMAVSITGRNVTGYVALSGGWSINDTAITAPYLSPDSPLIKFSAMVNQAYMAMFTNGVGQIYNTNKNGSKGYYFSNIWVGRNPNTGSTVNGIISRFILSNTYLCYDSGKQITL